MTLYIYIVHNSYCSVKWWNLAGCTASQNSVAATEKPSLCWKIILFIGYFFLYLISYCVVFPIVIVVNFAYPWIVDILAFFFYVVGFILYGVLVLPVVTLVSCCSSDEEEPETNTKKGPRKSRKARKAGKSGKTGKTGKQKKKEKQNANAEEMV